MNPIKININTNLEKNCPKECIDKFGNNSLRKLFSFYNISVIMYIDMGNTLVI